MALITYDLWGHKIDKVQMAIKRIREFWPEEGYSVGFSGGKDSVVIKALCDLAGVKYDAHYHLTTVDPPELVQFIRAKHPDVIWDRPTMTMWKLIVKKQMPPTRIARYCCKELKETHGDGRVVMTGVRWAESSNRQQNQGLVTLFDGKKATPVADDHGADYTQTKRGGIVLNLDNDAARRTVEMCYRTNKTLVNPIIDWSDDDVWAFIRHYNVPYCELYDEGWKRLGCIGCPLGSYASQRREFERWPKYKRMYIRAFDKMLEARAKAGKTNNDIWQNGEGVLAWWVGLVKAQSPGQMTIDDVI